ncbi:tetratricopeptide repeat protein [Pseudomonas sp. S2_D06]
MSQSTVTRRYQRYARAVFLALCLLEPASHVYSAEELTAIQHRAEQGDAAAQYTLGRRFANGEGVAQDSRQAVAWYRKAAKQGLVDAQYNLGICYDQGIGVGRDTKQAVAWFRKAAEQGHSDAQFLLGLGYASGSGIPQDYSQAYVWLSVAVANGNTSATEARDLVAKKLSNSQLEVMQKLAGQYFEKYQPKR